MRQGDGEAEPLDAEHRFLPSQARQALHEGRQKFLVDAEEGAVQKAPDHGACRKDQKENDGRLRGPGFHFQLQDYRGDEIDEAVARVANDDAEKQREVDHDRETDIALVVAGHGVDEIKDDLNGLQPRGQIKERRHGGIAAVGLLIPEAPARALRVLDELRHLGFRHVAFQIDDLAVDGDGVEGAGVGVAPLQFLKILFQNGQGAAQGIELFPGLSDPVQQALVFELQLFGGLFGKRDFRKVQSEIFLADQDEVDLAFRFGNDFLDNTQGRFRLLLFLALVELDGDAFPFQFLNERGIDFAPAFQGRKRIADLLGGFRILGDLLGEIQDFLDDHFGGEAGIFSRLRAVQKRVDDALERLDLFGNDFF